MLANLPSGRDIHSPPGPYKIPCLDEDQLVRMRAPPENDDFRADSEEDSDEDTTPGTYPERSESAYY